MTYQTEAERLRAKAQSKRKETARRRALRDLENHENRIRYWKDPERARAAARERLRRLRADPAHKLSASERLSRRKAEARRRDHKRALFWLSAAASRSLAELMNPSYTVIDAHGRRTRELWPIRDEASLWIEAHQPPAEDTASETSAVS